MFAGYINAKGRQVKLITLVDIEIGGSFYHCYNLPLEHFDFHIRNVSYKFNHYVVYNLLT